MKRYSPIYVQSRYKNISLYKSNKPLKFYTKRLYTPNFTRSYSTSKSSQSINLYNQINPLLVYNNFYKDRLKIYKDLKYKSGIYCLINKSNGHTYIGSSINLAARMRNYLNNSYLISKKNSNMPISKALLNYNNDFSLWIIEFVPEEYELRIRETYYISLIDPYYNVLKKGNTSIGYKHSDETKLLLSNLATNKKHNEVTKKLISDALKGENNHFYNKNHSNKSIIKIIKSKSKDPLYIYDSDKILLVIFPSVTTLSKLIKTNYSTIVKFTKDQSLFRGGWYFSYIPYDKNEIPFINDWSNKDSKDLIIEINNNHHIKKALFVYDINYNLLFKFDGVMDAKDKLKISHDTIKKYALSKKIYKDFIFSYSKL